MPLNPQVKAEVIKNIIKYEKKINHFYLDSQGYVTTGVGHMIKNKQAATLLPMNKVVNNQPGPPATPLEKQKEFETIAKQKRNYKAEWYKQFTTLIIKDVEITRQLDKHMDSFYRELSTLYKKSNGYYDDFDKLDKNIQVALFDMIFNLGAVKIVTKFTEFDKAIKTGDWIKAAKESYRPQLSAERNNYVRAKLSAANSIKVTTP
ncbi:MULTISPECIES: hypothetical protein [Pseudoalteromonas]|nr:MULTISPECIES: hypothetical protein [Pseudoalteromonas]MBE0377964.1 hypothetical protein [Pseudoalteromonas prydzensis ACAM 620]WKD23076.1 hypothetical protein NDQ71_15820 [Pseudoalteromonas sp. KG3]